MKKISVLSIGLIFVASLAIAANDTDGLVQQTNELTEQIQDLSARHKKSQLRTAYTRLGELYNQQKLYMNSIGAFELALSLEPGKKLLKRIYPGLGLAYESLGQAQKAIPFYQEACALMPKNPVWYGNLGRVYLLVELYDQALDSYHKALRLGSNDPAVYEGLGVIYKKTGFYDKAIKNFEMVLRIQPENDRIYDYLADIYESLYKIDIAIEMLSKANTIVPSVERYIKLGFLYLLQRDYDTALKSFYHARDLDPELDTVYQHIGVTYYKKGDLRQAHKALIEAIRLNRGNALAYFYLAQTQFQTGDLAEALKNAENAKQFAQTKMLSQYAEELLEKLKTISTR